MLSLPDVEVWLPTLKEHSILPCLLDSVKIWLEVRDVEKRKNIGNKELKSSVEGCDMYQVFHREPSI